ncbi:DUF5786 family protein [Halegenticoccus soli]|uniref:DUF5786 family protein n=1 Tax=Halegenticoccus soli TaxID=1985678 RepID=UPI000C6E53BE|nr:DUF5786 family protein [Halegenticoccus soli]
MGFGSYDESEQQRRNSNPDGEEAEGVNVHANDHQGTVSFESDASTADLVDQLGAIKRSKADE